MTIVTRRSAVAMMAAGAGAAALAPANAATTQKDGASGRTAEVLPSRAEASLTIISPVLLEAQARGSLPAACFEYIHGGAGDEWTERANIGRLHATVLYPRRLGGFSVADTTARFLDTNVPAPLYVCPMGAQDYANSAAEIASARGAAQAGIPYILSSASNRSLEEVAHAMPTGAVRLFAIYLNKDPAVNRSLCRRARAAGYSALVMTVDSLGPGTSERFVAMGSPKTPQSGYGNFDPARGGTGEFLALKRDFAPSDVTALRQESGLPVLVKGILRPEDALRATDAGATGIIVSNHGGRTLDGAPAAIDVLGPIVNAVGGRVPVFFDSGVRRGTDVIRALALGATAVGIGRPVLDALALGGAQGVSDLLAWFKKDLATQMLQVGAPHVRDITADLLSPPGSR